MPNAMNAAMPYFNNAMDLYNPYAQQGQEAYNQLNPLFSQMSQDPTAFYENLIKNYQPSQSYNLKRDEALNAASATAAAGGRRGTPQDMMDQARITDALLGEDMQQWYNNVLGLQDRGMQGLGNFYGTGYDAINNQANIYGTQGSLAFQNAQQQNKDRSNMWRNFAKLGTTALGAGIGSIVPGIGTAAGAAIGSRLF